MTSFTAKPTAGSSRWLSHEFAELLAELDRNSKQPDRQPMFDVLIVGSGYGGAMAAAELAGSVDEQGRPIRLGLLERGREYLPGSFPSRMAELPGSLRGSFGGPARGGEGLFDVHAGGDLSVVTANGLGGGSLINAGVMERPKPEVFDARWPARLREPAQREPYYQRAKALLGASQAGADNHIGAHAAGRPLKNRLLQTLAAQSRKNLPANVYRDAAITVAMRDRITSGGVQLSACKLCGDCASGCNYSAKESLDTNLLVQAQRRGAEIYCGATALRLQKNHRGGSGWLLQVRPTDEKLSLREGRPVWISARKLILAAGTLGSTEILLRSQRRRPGLSFSARLGQGFSGNGDLLGFGYDYRPEANAIADEDQPPAERQIGPTITGVIDAVVQTPAGQQAIVIEELAVPGPLRRATEELLTTADTLHALAEIDTSRHRYGHPEDDPYAVNPRKLRHSAVFAAMGDDGAAGRLELREADRGSGQDGHLHVVWPEVGKLPLFDAQMQCIEDLAKAAGFGGRSLPNPLWRPLPAAMEFLLRDQRGPLLSVHPLGGCAMADSVAEGVVNEYGQVFDPDSSAAQPLHEGLMVLDGAILPSALATNPALSIAALSLRAVEHLREQWQWRQPGGGYREGEAGITRPVLADTEALIQQRAREPRQLTLAEFSERLSGPVQLRDAQGVVRDCQVEISLSYAPLPLQQLFRPDAQGRMSAAKLEIAPDAGAGRGLLRIFLKSDWQRLQKAEVSEARLSRALARARSYELSGSLTILKREPTNLAGRLLGRLPAWALNRGLRDTVQEVGEQLWRYWQGYPRQGPGPWQRLLGALQLASHAGEVRLFEYQLLIGAELPSSFRGRRFLPALPLPGAAILGGKRIHYGRPSNPWRQLQELSLSEFPGLVRASRAPVLSLDLPYLAARGAPLFRFTAQREHLEALTDAASLLAYFARMLLSIHLWNARKPDLPAPRAVQRLPGELPGLPKPEIHRLETDRLDEQPVEIQLSRYRSQSAPALPARPPVVLIHGYSASGTSFAHHSLKPSLAQYLAEAGREVWVLDLRSSCGLPTASWPWSFERIGLFDIPAAIDYVCQKSGQAQVDVVAHCMGAAMLSMAVLSADQPLRKVLSRRESRVIDRFPAARRALPGRIRRAVLSQIGPWMVMSPANVFRAYLLSFVEQALGPMVYPFRPEAGQGLAMELLDRLLATTPYPDEELLLENPARPGARTEYSGSRHRMDALYGRTFKLANLSAETLAHIDDFFGPLSLDSVAQVIHFASQRGITNRAGRNRFLSPRSLRAHWRFPTLSLHGEENGLADASTVYRMKSHLRAAGCDYRYRMLPGRGHQDCLIGKDNRETFGHIEDFLVAEMPLLPPPRRPYRFTAEPAWLGPVQLSGDFGELFLGLGASPRLGAPLALCLLPVVLRQGRWQIEHPGAQLLPAMPGWARLPGCLKVFSAQQDSDWFSLPLPPWWGDARIQRVAALLIYPQPDGRDAGASLTAAAQPLAYQSLLLPAKAQHAVAADAVTEGFDADADCYRAIATALRAALAGLGNTADPPELLIPLAARASGQAVQLALGSCQYPPGLLDRLPAYQSWQRLGQALRERRVQPSLAILTGDQVYTDATAGLFDPVQADSRIRIPYETWLREPAVRDVLRRVPMVSLFDDHEIEDNWEPIARSAGNAAVRQNRLRLKQGLAGFLRYQRPQQGLAGRQSWFSFEHQGLSIFLLDSRSGRSGRRAGHSGELLDGTQATALKAWLLGERQKGRPKLIVGPALLLPRHRSSVPALLADGACDAGPQAALRSDGWDGHPQSHHWLLNLIVTNGIQGLIFLSGDEHLGLLARVRMLTPQGRELLIHSIHTPGLYTPYGFANSRAEDFLLKETIHFPAGENSAEFHCEVATSVYQTTGFTLLSMAETEPGRCWTLRCDFGGEGPAQELLIPVS